MKRTIEAQGRSVDEAIFTGLGELGISIDEVSIEIVKSESKGIFGLGAKPAIVRLTEKEPDEVVVPDFEALARKNAEERRKERESRPRDYGRSDETRGGYNRDNRDGRDETRGYSRDNRSGNRGNRSERPRYDQHPRTYENAAAPAAQASDAPAQELENAPVRRRSDRPRRSTRDDRSPRKDLERKLASESILTAPKPEISYSASGASDDKAAAFLKGLIERMSVEGNVLIGTVEAGESATDAANEAAADAAAADAVEAAKSAEQDAAAEETAEGEGEQEKKDRTPTKYLRIDSDTMGILIGHRGETLDAMQYLTSLAINKNRREEGYTRVTIDTEGYRDKREETLMRLARKVASQVKATGRPRALEPMNPYERRILHSTLQNHPFVTTHSEGEEPNRRVVVTPKRRGY